MLSFSSTVSQKEADLVLSSMENYTPEERKYIVKGIIPETPILKSVKLRIKKFYKC